MSIRILIVEDEPSIRENLVYALESEGYEVVICGTGEEALVLGADPSVALAVLDVGLPDITGFEVCRILCARRRLPVIFLTARASEIDRVVGLEIGADDYVVKPFSMRELTARVRAVLRRTGAANPADSSNSGATTAEGGSPFRVDVGRLQIQYCGEVLVLSRTEFRLLQWLIAHPGRVFSRAQLMDHAWEEPEAALERTVDSHVKSIRSKLREIDPDRDPILTHRGVGYAMTEDW